MSKSREVALSATCRLLLSSWRRPSRLRLPMAVRMRLAADTVAQCTAAWKDPAPFSFTRAPAGSRPFSWNQEQETSGITGSYAGS